MPCRKPGWPASSTIAIRSCPARSITCQTVACWIASPTSDQWPPLPTRLEAFQSYLKNNGYSFAVLDRSDGRLRYRALHTADPRLIQMASDRGYITPFFRPMIRQYQIAELSNLSNLRHPLILGDECAISTYWQLQFQAFGTGFCIADRITIVPVASNRQARLVRRFYDVLIPSLLGKDTN